MLSSLQLKLHKEDEHARQHQMVGLGASTRHPRTSERNWLRMHNYGHLLNKRTFQPTFQCGQVARWVHTRPVCPMQGRPRSPGIHESCGTTTFLSADVANPCDMKIEVAIIRMMPRCPGQVDEDSVPLEPSADLEEPPGWSIIPSYPVKQAHYKEGFYAKQPAAKQTSYSAGFFG